MYPISTPADQRRTRSSHICIALMTALATAAPASGQLGDPSEEPQEQSVEALFEDFLHFARLGRFDLADRRAGLLLEHHDLDPVALVAIADRDKRSLETLMIIIRNSTLGENAARVLEVIRQGEFELRRNPDRIRRNVEKLGGPPQMEHNATDHLIASGEYAVPWMLHTLLDPARSKLHARVLAALLKIGRAAVNPLVAALEMEDQGVRSQIMRTLGGIGYAQAVPYLQKVMLDPEASAPTQAAAAEAIRAIEARTLRATVPLAAEGFFRLAEQHYDEIGSVAADPRLPTANVWYWNPDTRFVEAVPVPQRIFGQVAAMRCCEESLRIDPSGGQAIALWLAANIRREARLGLDVESAEPGEPAEPDATRPEDFPSSLYFTRAAGARYAHLVLARAVKDRDAPVALGAIAALREVAGEASLVGSEDHKQPLVQALSFPDRVVRIRAALALGNALPRSPFAGSVLVVPVLARALTQAGADSFVVVDADADNLNRLAGELRQGTAKVIAEDNFYKAMDRARRELDSVSAFLLTTDVSGPGVVTAVQALRREFVYARTPIIVLVKPGGNTTAEQLAGAHDTVGHLDAGAGGTELMDRLGDLRSASGEIKLDDALAAALAFEAASTFHRIALDGRTVFDYAAAEPALVSALASGDEEVGARCLLVLALIATADAQRAIAEVALDDANSESLRLAAFDALASSAKGYGNRLDGGLVARLLQVARDEPDLGMRTVASKALGALDLADNKASDIIRSYYRG